MVIFTFPSSNQKVTLRQVYWSFLSFTVPHEKTAFGRVGAIKDELVCLSNIKHCLVFPWQEQW